MNGSEEITLKSPATGESLGGLRKDGMLDLQAAVSRARSAQGQWAELPVRERGERLRAFGAFLAAHTDEAAETVARCTGKTRIDALSAEILPAILAARYYIRRARGALKPRRIFPGSLLFLNKRSILHRVPYGVLGVISPWNFPLGIPAHPILQGLLAGNGVILKVATQVQPVGDLIRAAFETCRLPDGLFGLVHMTGREAGAAFLEAGLDKILFTGSTAVGKELAAKAGERLLPVSLELGGKDAMIVLRNANLFRAAAGAAWAGLSNCGQACAAVERIYVEEPVYDDFLVLLRRQVESLRQGPFTSWDVDIGSLTVPEQLETVKRHLADALEKGAVVSSSSRETSGPGLFHPAMVLEKVSEEMLVMREETFGPILAVERVRDGREAVELANRSNYGLTASVWTDDAREAREIASRLLVGTVTVNDHLMSAGMAETPWGGFKDSGGGRQHGLLGFEEVTQARVVIEDRLHRLPRAMWWYPHNREVYDGLKGVLDAFYGPGFLHRLRGLARMAGLFRRSFRRRD